MEEPVPEECFSVEKVTNSVYLIKEIFNVSNNVCNIWLSKGSSLDVIIDTGLGIWDLPGFLKSKELIGSKPYMAVATHIHFDHTGGFYQFETTAIHADEYNDMRAGNAVNIVTCLKEGDIAPEYNYSVKDFRVRPVTASRVLNDGDIIDQGDHRLQMIHLPGHTKGSIALYDYQDKHLFIGDVLYDGMLIDFVPTSSVQEYLESSKQLVEMAPNVGMVFPGHFRILTGQEMCFLANKYIADGERNLYRCSRGCVKCVVAAIFKGRNTTSVPYKCFY